MSLAHDASAPSPGRRPDPQKVLVGGVPVDRLDREEWVELLLRDADEKARSGRPAKVVTTANGQVVSLFGANAVFRDALLRADHVAADGMSIVTASRLHPSARLPERVATTDWFHDAARAASANGLRFYFLGAEQGALDRALAGVAESYPDLQIAGARNGYFGDDEAPQIARDVERARADVLWIGVGNPRQLLLAHRFAELCPGLTWVRTCGGLFDFLSGDRPRAPEAMQKAGLEWAFRLADDPRRLFWRYATTNVHSAILLALKSRGPISPEGLRRLG